MHLHSLELFGFKSFADKTTFDFHEGITAIVGPNGCGKSNVLDAVRWVLGEQSAKSLRGDEMADVIFNGTDTRKPVGFAEVSLTLSDCAADLAVDWHDVRVTRRVYRDGNSEYLLNKTPCRLRDIQNLFADTGVARAAYSMMEQGKIDMVLSSRPEDRLAAQRCSRAVSRYRRRRRCLQRHRAGPRGAASGKQPKRTPDNFRRSGRNYKIQNAETRGVAQTRRDRSKSLAYRRRDQRSKATDRLFATPGRQGAALPSVTY